METITLIHMVRLDALAVLQAVSVVTTPPTPTALQTQPEAPQVATAATIPLIHTAPQTQLEAQVVTAHRTQIPGLVATVTTPLRETMIHQTTVETRKATPLLASCSRRQAIFSRTMA